MESIEALLASPEITIAATHGLLLDGAREYLSHESVRDIFVTDTVVPIEKDWPQLKVISVAPLLAGAIQRFMTDGSLRRRVLNEDIMNKQVLFIQGAGKGAYKEDEKLVASLRQLLGREYEVHYPAMQNEDEANYETWKGQIEKNLAALDGMVIVVGHSIGASILIKCLPEGDVKKISGIFLIATPFWGGDKGWKYEGYEALALPEGHAQLPANARVFFYHSRDDEIVPFAHLALYAQKFPKATIRELNGCGHQLNNDLSEVAEDIKSLQH